MKQTDSDDYAERMKAVYDRSNEKAKLLAELSKIFKNQSFEHSLDIGPGPGTMTEILAKHSNKLTLVEITEDYRLTLAKKFPKAKVVIDSINSVQLNEKFDAILYSQGLYYQDECDWLEVCKKLYHSLKPGGQLVVIMCTDSGDYWDIMNYAWTARPELKAYHFKKWSEFLVELRTVAAVEEHYFTYESYCKQSEVMDFIGGCMLAVMNRNLLEENGHLLRDYCKKYWIDGGDIKLEINCGIAILRH